MSKTLQNLEKKQLVVKVDGLVTASNVHEFQEQAVAILGSINTDLVTDQDFTEARANIKSCKAIEIHIENAKQKAIMSMDDVAKVMTALDTVKDDFAKIRIQLFNADKKRTVERKQEIIQDGIKEVTDVIESCTVRHGVSCSSVSITEATKNKRSFSSMEAAVELVVEKQIEDIRSLETKYAINIAELVNAEIDYPGIFPDKDTVALKDTEMVQLEITARVERQKLKLKEAEELKERQAKEAAEKEKAEKEKAEESKEPVNIDDSREPQKEEPGRSGFDLGKEQVSPFANIAEDPFSNADTGTTTWKITALFKRENIDEVVQNIRETPGFSSVNVEIK